MKKGMAFVVLLFAAGVASASSAGLDMGGKTGFEEQRTQLMADLADGETYAEISAEDREKVVSALGRMQRILGDGTPAALSPDDRAALMNEQELVNNLLTQARKDSRLVCARETPVGTRMPTTVCRTVAESRRQRENSRRDLEAAGRSRAKRVE